jgi:hypothetical protein
MHPCNTTPKPNIDIDIDIDINTSPSSTSRPDPASSTTCRGPQPQTANSGAIVSTANRDPICKLYVAWLLVGQGEIDKLVLF